MIPLLFTKFLSLFPTLSIALGVYMTPILLFFWLYTYFTRKANSFGAVRNILTPVMTLFWLSNYSIFLEPIFGSKVEFYNETDAKVEDEALKFFEMHYTTFFWSSFMQHWLVVTVINAHLVCKEIHFVKLHRMTAFIFIFNFLASQVFLPIKVKVIKDNYFIVPENEYNMMMFGIHIITMVFVIVFSLQWCLSISRKNRLLKIFLVFAMIVFTTNLLAYIFFWVTMWFQDLEMLIFTANITMAIISTLVSFVGLFVILISDLNSLESLKSTFRHILHRWRRSRRIAVTNSFCQL